MLCVAIAACARLDVAAIFDAYQWEKRVLVVFSPTRDDVQLKAQMDVILAQAAALEERDFVVWVLVANQSVMVDGEAKPHLFTRPFYGHFGVKESEFMVLMVGKDGGEKLRKTEAVGADELLALVDAMPMRKREKVE